MERSKESRVSVSYKHLLIGIKLLDELFFFTQASKYASFETSSETMAAHFSQLDFEFAKDEGRFPEYLQRLFHNLSVLRDNFPIKDVVHEIMETSFIALNGAIKGGFLIAHYYLGVLYVNHILGITKFPYFHAGGPYRVLDSHDYDFEGKCDFLRALSFRMSPEYINFYNDNFSQIQLKFFKTENTVENTITKSLYALCDLCTPYDVLRMINEEDYDEKIKGHRYHYKSAEFPHLAEFSKIIAGVVLSIRQNEVYSHSRVNKWIGFLHQYMAIYNVFRYLHAHKDIKDDDQKYRQTLFSRDLQRIVDFPGPSLGLYFTRTGEKYKLYIPTFLGIPFGRTQHFQDLRMRIGESTSLGLKEAAECFIQCLNSHPHESFAFSLCPAIPISARESDVSANFEIEETDEEENPEMESTNSL